MSVLMEDDSIVKVAVSLRVGPEIHLHPGTIAIRGSIKVCVICAAAILSFRVNMIAFLAAFPVIIELKIPGLFIKSIGIKEVVSDVVPVK